MKFQLACGDVMPGCPTTFSHESRDALFSAVADHAAEAHGITDITPDVQALVSRHVRKVD